MAIRNAAKAIVRHKNAVLVNKCIDDQGAVYYDLPGGGQHQFETIEEALAREVLEETGFFVSIERFVALAEEICDNPELRSKYPEHSHKILHIFLVGLADETMNEVTELDLHQQGSVWVPLDEIDALPFRPSQLTGKISKLIHKNYPQYLGYSRVL